MDSKGKGATNPSPPHENPHLNYQELRCGLTQKEKIRMFSRKKFERGRATYRERREKIFLFL